MYLYSSTTPPPFPNRRSSLSDARLIAATKPSLIFVNPKSRNPLGFYKSHFGVVAGGCSGTVTSEVPSPHTATSS